MTTEQLRRAADALWDHWQQGTSLPALPRSMRPSTREQGYAIQACLERAPAFPLFGWKIAATSKAGQAHIAVDGPLAGRLLRERVRESGDEVPFGRHRRCGCAEAEFAFRMAAHLAPRACALRCRRGPGRRGHTCIQQSRCPIRASRTSRASARRSSLPTTPARTTSCSARPLRAAGETRPRRASRDRARSPGSCSAKGEGANVLGDPRVALAWLANELSSLGLTLEAGQVVTTGTCLVPLPRSPPATTCAWTLASSGRWRR